MSSVRQLSLFDDGLLRQDTPLKHAVRPFLDYLRAEGKTENTVKSFRSDMNLVQKFFTPEIPLNSMTTERLKQFLTWLEFGRGVPCSRKSYARRVTTLKVFFRWLNEIKVMMTNPAKPLVQRSGPAPLQPILSRDEVKNLIDTANHMRTAEKPDSRPALLLQLLLETGIKKSETARLMQKHFEQRDAERPQLMISYKRQNVFKERRVPISRHVLTLLDEYNAQYKPKKGGVFNCTTRNLEYILNDLATAAGVESKVSFETMRWTSAVLDHLEGMDQDKLREKMGLSEISWRETGQKIIRLASKMNADQKTATGD